MPWQGVIGSAHQPRLPFFSHILSHVSEHSRRYGEHHNHHPHAYNHPGHHLPAEHGRHFPGQHHYHHPVQAHEHDQEDGGIHVGVAQVEDGFAHKVAIHPCLLGQVDDEEDGEGHEEAVGTRQVEDEDGGDRTVFDAGQNAPDDEDVARDAQEEDQAQDEGAEGCGEVIAHDAWILKSGIIGGGHAEKRFQL